MHLTYLKVSNFRNLSQLEIKPTAAVNIFFGSNGSGKSNLLEAIFLLNLGRSQRGHTDSVLIESGREAYRVEGIIRDSSGENEIAVAYLNRGRKQITINGVKSRIAELYDKFSAVAIGPEDSEILSGPPSARRLFMDIYISQYSRKYLEELSRYNRILAQKSAALKENLECEPFNNLLVDSGKEIMKTRGQFISALQVQAAEYYKHFSDGSNLTLKYAPSVFDGADWNEKIVESEFEKRLDEVKEKENLLRTALVGPHRDEIVILIDDLPARSYGSQGEWRSSAIALKLAVYKLLREKRKFSPILLLDEVFAELDRDRATALIESFGDFEQLFLTTAVEPPLQLKEKSANFKVENGTVQRVD
jgi:DNA replication and repair protein RecF